MGKTKAERKGLVGFSGRWPKVFHAVRPGTGRAHCGNFTRLDFFHDYPEMPDFNERAATALTPCQSCFGPELDAAKAWPQESQKKEAGR